MYVNEIQDSNNGPALAYLDSLEKEQKIKRSKTASRLKKNEKQIFATAR